MVVADAGGGAALVDELLAAAEEVASADEVVAGLAEFEVSVLGSAVRPAIRMTARRSAPAIAHQRLYQAV